MNNYFILAPREMSDARIKQLLKKYLPRGKVTFGIAKEKYIAGFENQPQFKTLSSALLSRLASQSAGRLELFEYAQCDGVKIIEQLDFTHAIVINGSFHRSFHLRPEFAAINSKPAKLKYESPFTDEAEAIRYAKNHNSPRPLPEFSENSIQQILAQESTRAFITDFQTAAAIVKDNQIIALTHNPVVPYETYAWHFGLSREKHQTPAGDSSQYDTVHAETAALLQAGLQAKGATIYMRTFPCPHCARNIVHAGISEVVYQLDYGDRYGYDLFEKANINYRRLP